MASTAAELAWLSFILRGLGIPLPCPPILHCDNLSALYMTMNPVFHGWTEHIELDYHYVHERVALGALETCFVPSKHQLANIFTKPLSKALFLDLRLKRGLVFDPCHSLRGSENITDMKFTSKSTSADLERNWYGSYCRICSNRFGKLLNQLVHNSLHHIFHNSSLWQWNITATMY